jgi:hypothetical protein
MSSRKRSSPWASLKSAFWTDPSGRSNDTSIHSQVGSVHVQGSDYLPNRVLAEPYQNQHKPAPPYQSQFQLGGDLGFGGSTNQQQAASSQAVALAECKKALADQAVALAECKKALADQAVALAECKKALADAFRQRPIKAAAAPPKKQRQHVSNARTIDADLYEWLPNVPGSASRTRPKRQTIRRKRADRRDQMGNIKPKARKY